MLLLPLAVLLLLAAAEGTATTMESHYIFLATAKPDVIKLVHDMVPGLVEAFKKTYGSNKILGYHNMVGTPNNGSIFMMFEFPSRETHTTFEMFCLQNQTFLVAIFSLDTYSVVDAWGPAGASKI